MKSYKLYKSNRVSIDEVFAFFAEKEKSAYKKLHSLLYILNKPLGLLESTVLLKFTYHVNYVYSPEVILLYEEYLFNKNTQLVPVFLKEVCTSLWSECITIATYLYVSNHFPQEDTAILRTSQLMKLHENEVREAVSTWIKFQYKIRMCKF